MSTPTKVEPKCKECAKAGRDHMDHVREYMIKAYGSANCLRKECDELATHPSGYCSTHHTEWIHGENGRHLLAQATDSRE